MRFSSRKDRPAAVTRVRKVRLLSDAELWKRLEQLHSANQAASKHYGVLLAEAKKRGLDVPANLRSRESRDTSPPRIYARQPESTSRSRYSWY